MGIGFFKRLVPLKANASVLLDKPAFFEGEPITGRVLVESNEAIHGDEVRLEIRVLERFYAPVTHYSRGHVHQTMAMRTKVIYPKDVRISGPLDITPKENKEFPFSVDIPLVRPTMPSGIIDRKMKGVLAVKGRPDKTQEVIVNVSPAPYAPAAAAPVREVIKEVIVKVPCKYCGGLIPIEQNKCSLCGAKLSK